MTEQQKHAIIESGKQYFRSIIKLSYFDCLSDLPLDSLDFDPYFINYLSTSTKKDSQFVELAKDKGFYIRMLKALGEVLDEGNFEGSELIQAKVKEIAGEIRQGV